MNRYIKIQIVLAIICFVICIVKIIYGDYKVGLFLLVINAIIIAISIYGHWEIQKWYDPKKYKKFYKNPNYSEICSSCNKELVAGAFPEWVCLNKNCGEYLKSKIK